MGTIDNTLEQRRALHGPLDNEGPARIIMFQTREELDAKKYANAARCEAKHLRNMGWTEDDMKYASLFDNLADAIWQTPRANHLDPPDQRGYWRF